MSQGFDVDALRPSPTAPAAPQDSNFIANRPIVDEPVKNANWAGNPWAMPLTREASEAYDQSMSTLRHENFAGDDAKRDELIKAAMPGTLDLRASGGEAFHSRNTSDSRHGAWSSPDRMSQPEAVDKLALAWTGQVDDNGVQRPAARDEQHQHETEWVAAGGAKRLHSIAAPQLHPDGSILAGGGRQIWHPGDRALGRPTGLGVDEVKRGTVGRLAERFGGSMFRGLGGRTS
jgi:hypothetical protein